MENDHYESWLAKQAAMGRRAPDTTAPYYAPAVNIDNPAPEHLEQAERTLDEMFPAAGRPK